MNEIEDVVKQEPEEHITQLVKLEPLTEDDLGPGYTRIKQEIKDEVDVSPTVLQKVQPTLIWSVEIAESLLASTADNNTYKNCKQDDSIVSTENNHPKIKKEREEEGREFSCSVVRSDLDNITTKTEVREDLHKTKIIKVDNMADTLDEEYSGAVLNMTQDPLPEKSVVIRNYSRAKHTIIPSRHYINDADDEEIEETDKHIITNSLCECKFECYNKFTKKQTLAISKEFAKLKPRQQNTLIKCLVSHVEIMHKMEYRRRTIYHKFFLPSPEGTEKIRVCKKFFVKAIGFKKDERLLMRLLKPPDLTCKRPRI